MQILKHGNNSEGYSVLESVISIFIASLLITVVFSLIIIFFKISDKTIKTVESFIEDQNVRVEKIISD